MAPVRSHLAFKTSRITSLSYLTTATSGSGRITATTTSMDIVLEIADTFIFDHAYAKFLPVVTSPLAANATFSSIKEEPTAFALPAATWQYEPATKYFSIEPSQAAYETAWPRDDWRRQLLTLYLITWCVNPALWTHSQPANTLNAGYSVSLFTTSSRLPPTFSSLTRRPLPTHGT